MHDTAPLSLRPSVKASKSVRECAHQAGGAERGAERGVKRTCTCAGWMLLHAACVRATSMCSLGVPAHLQRHAQLAQLWAVRQPAHAGTLGMHTHTQARRPLDEWTDNEHISTAQLKVQPTMAGLKHQPAYTT